MSQFKKRQEKAAKEIKNPHTGTELDTILDPVIETIEQDVMTHTAIDIYINPATRKHEAVILTYNPLSGAAKVKEVKPVSRSIALLFENNKKALNTIVKVKK